MKNKKLLAGLMAVSLSATLMACGNNTAKAPEKPSQEEITSEDIKNGNVAVEPEPSNEVEKKDAGEKGIYDLEFTYLPDKFVENFKDEKKDLRTVEYMAEKNPAKKITLQISDNDDRIKELAKVPDSAEDIKISDNTGKYWDDGSFNYIFVKEGKNTIYSRSNLDKDEAVKVVEAIK